MDSPSRQELEVMQTLVEMSFGEASEAQYADLDALVRENAAIRKHVVTSLTHLADLEWENCGRRRDVPPPNTEQLDFGVPATAGRPPASHDAEGKAELMPRPTNAGRGQRRALGTWIGICGSFLLGASCALWFAHHGGDVFHPDDDLAVLREHSALPVATLVSNTSFMWDARKGVAMEAGAKLLAGQSVVLFSGVAEIAYESGVTTRMQGPAMLSIDGSGTLELKYGKFVVKNMGSEHAELEVPLARCVTDQGSIIGVDAFGAEVVVHALDGGSTLRPTMGEREPITLSSGEAVRLLTTARSKIGVYNSVAAPGTFDFDALTETDSLSISREYVELIKQSGPVAYWRFEEFIGNEIVNEMRKGHELRRLGDKVRLIRHGENRCADFVVRESPGGLVAIEDFEELASHVYSVEFWVKPSHYHRGAIVSLVEQSTDELGSIERHGLIVEIHSADPVMRAGEGQPRALRFLHRSPPEIGLTGTSCFSPLPYKTQLWQHVAAVKNGKTMQLFIDGELASTATDESPLPKNLSLIVGQLFSFGTVRPFVGQLDEMAVYDRALSADEIRLRVQLVRAANAGAK